MSYTVKINPVTVLEKISLENSSFPVLKLSDEAGSRLGYLSPFRGYCFQVSATRDGDGDRGSSDIVGLGNLVRGLTSENFTKGKLSSSNHRNIAKAMFKVLAESALYRAGLMIQGYDQTIAFESFIDDCYQWVVEYIED